MRSTGRGHTGDACTEALSEGGEAVLLRVTDDLRAAALGVPRPKLRAHAAAGGQVAVVDVSGLTRVSSLTLTGLLLTKRRCRALGVRLQVRGAAPVVHPVLHRAGLLDDRSAGVS